MKFIDKMIARKSQNSAAVDKEEGVIDPVKDDLLNAAGSAALERSTPTGGESSLDVESLMAMVNKPVKPNSDTGTNTKVEAKAEKAQVNIWDLDAEDDTVAPAPELQPLVVESPIAPAPATAATPAPNKVVTPIPPAAIGQPKRRPGRVKTRLLGFEHTDESVVDLFDPDAAIAKSKSVKYPVGWIVVVDGPGRGESFTLLSGMSQIGRGDDQAIQLNFGDCSISRDNHAAIAYDPESHHFLLGHGGKSNIVRLNDKPVLSTEELKDTDLIRIGETTLRFVPLCSPQFNWTEDKTSGDGDDVAIA